MHLESTGRTHRDSLWLLSMADPTAPIMLHLLYALNLCLASGVFTLWYHERLNGFDHIADCQISTWYVEPASGVQGIWPRRTYSISTAEADN